ncbi:transposase [Cereibacter changlensis]|uniref:transposase n=1 Tax=Cereibacter changlensis TaxID=402884 RepID=UPI000DAE92FD
MGSIWTVHGMIEILDVVNSGRRRRFRVAEKMRIVEEGLAGPNQARSTARRHGIALSGLYLWRRQYRRGDPRPDRTRLPAGCRSACATHHLARAAAAACRSQRRMGAPVGDRR